jgi:glycosyltransferase involved in cell wall biosynthesis
MNIIIINDYASVNGGAAQVAVISARALADAGNNVVYIYGTGAAAPELMHKNIKLIDLKQYDLLTNPSKLNAFFVGIWNQHNATTLSEILKDYSPKDTVVHIHAWVKALSPSVLKSTIDSGLPHVVTLHDYFSACPNGGFYNFQSKTICTKKPLSYDCITTHCDVRNYPQKLWRVTRQCITKNAGMPTKIENFIYVSEFSKKILEPFLSKNSNLWKINNPIDISKAPPGNAALSEAITYVGRLAAEKGVELFAEAAKTAKAQARFVGAGELLDSLRKIYPAAEFTGWADRGTVCEYIKNSRAIVVPSMLYETQGMVVVEAAALGIPCIVSDSCAGRDFVEPNVTGLWFKGGDSTSLSKAILRLKNDPDFAAQLGKRAYDAYWASPPDLKTHVTALSCCYESMIQNHKVNNRQEPAYQ